MKLENKRDVFISCESGYEDAEVVIFGAPFDGTVSNRPGTRFAPSAIRRESFGIETYSPYSDRDLTDRAVFDMGDLDLPFGNTAKVLDLIENFTERVLSDGKIPLMIGGEHLVTLGVLRAAVRKYPDLHIIHFDAHTDLREEYLGEPLSHSTVIRHAHTLVGDGKIHQFGIRSGEKFEFEFGRQHCDFHPFDLADFYGIIPKLSGVPVYFTLDLDVLDPSIMCGTGTPEAGGVSFRELMGALLRLNELNIIGCDINELSPHYDPSGASTAAACVITREIILQLKGK